MNICDDIISVRDRLLPLLDKCAVLASRSDQKGKADIFTDYKNRVKDARFLIALVGFAKRGKSTLLNAFLGRADTKLAPVSALVCTAVLTKYYDKSLNPMKSGEEGAIVTFKNAGIDSKEIALTELSQYVEDQYNKENEKGVSQLDIYSHFPLIGDRAVMVDSPGRGVCEAHDDLSDQILPNADAIILLTAADQPGTANELAFLKSLDESIKDKMLFVLTKCDEKLEPEDIESGEQSFRKVLSEVGAEYTKKIVYRVGAEPIVRAYKKSASKEEISRLEDKYGLAKLKTAITKTIPKDYLRNLLKSAILDMQAFLDEEAGIIEGVLGLAEKDKAEIDAVRAECEKSRKEMERDFTKQERKFKAAWDREMVRLPGQMMLVKQEIVNELLNETSRKNILNLIGYSNQLARSINEKIHIHLKGPVSSVEERLLTHVETLQDGGFLEDEGNDVVLSSMNTSTTPKAARILKAEAGTIAGIGVGALGIMRGLNLSRGAVKTMGAAIEGISSANANASVAEKEFEAAIQRKGLAETQLEDWKRLNERTGFFGNIVDFFVGKPKPDLTPVFRANDGINSAQGALVTAQRAATLATSNALSAVVGNLLPLVGGLAAAYFAVKIGNSIAKGYMEKQIPSMVDEQFKTVSEKITGLMAEIRDSYLEKMKWQLLDRQNAIQEKLDDVNDALENRDETKLADLKKRLPELEALKNQLVAVNGSLAGI